MQSSASSTGGSSDEAGGAYRRGLVAFFAAHGLNGLPVSGLPFTGSDAIVDGVAAEVAFAVDDVLVELAGGRLFIQAKRTLRFGRPMREVADQWLAAVRHPQFRPDTDLIGAASGELAGPIRELALGLDRRRHGATIFSVAQEQALNRLKRLLRDRGASAPEVEKALARGIILELKVEEFGQEDSDRGRLLLDGHVVAKGEGGRAWRELLSISGEAARLRLGHSIPAWQFELGKRGLPLTIDSVASRSAYLARRAEAMNRYRSGLRKRGEYVDLTAIGLGVPPIPLSEMDSDIGVRTGDDERGSGDDLLWALRRRGRITLTGLPGGGKSTALRAVAAEWGRRDDWSVPIFVSLKKVAAHDLFRKRPLHYQVVDDAIQTVQPKDEKLVREALGEALDQGHALLILDGLDEAADRSQMLASDIAELLKGIHPDTDVLLATRDVAFADASMLRFDVFRLGRPTEQLVPVTAVLRAIALQRGVGDQESWVNARVEWIEEALARDHQLGETPLLPVLLASIAADHEAANLPHTRLGILGQVVEDVVRRCESKRQVRITGLPDSQQASAVLGTFKQIAVTLSQKGGGAPRAELITNIAAYLECDWGLPLGPSQTTAEEILLFWDDSGMFVAQGAQKTVSARHSLFQEMGAALFSASLPNDKAVAWVKGAAPKPELKETIQLAATRSRVIADALIDVVCSGPPNDPYDRLASAAADALDQGGTASVPQLRRLIARLQEQIVFGDAEGWRAFRRLARLAVPADLIDPLLKSVGNHFSAEHAAIARANAVLFWGWDSGRAIEHCEAALRVATLPALRRRFDRGGLDLDLLADDLFARVIENAATALIPTRPDLAEILAESVHHLPMYATQAIIKVLRANGYDEIADRTNAKYLDDNGFVERIRAGARQTDEDIRNLLNSLASHSPSAELSLSQGRRLRELASYVETLDLNAIPAWMRGARWRDLKEPFFRLIGELGGFDESTLGAQAKLMLQEIAGGSGRGNAAFFSLFQGAGAAELSRWTQVSDPIEARALLLRILHAPRPSAVVAAKALATHPDGDDTAQLIEKEFSKLPRESVLPAIWAHLSLVSEPDKRALLLARSQFSSIREAVARSVTIIDKGKRNELAELFAHDPNRQVRLAAVGCAKADQPSAELVAFLESIAQDVDPPFTCYHCGTENPSANDSCSSCHVVTPRPSREAASLIESLRKTLTKPQGAAVASEANLPADKQALRAPSVALSRAPTRG